MVRMFVGDGGAEGADPRRASRSGALGPATSVKPIMPSMATRVVRGSEPQTTRDSKSADRRRRVAAGRRAALGRIAALEARIQELSGEVVAARRALAASQTTGVPVGGFATCLPFGPALELAARSAERLPVDPTDAILLNNLEAHLMRSAGHLMPSPSSDVVTTLREVCTAGVSFPLDAELRRACVAHKVVRCFEFLPRWRYVVVAVAAPRTAGESCVGSVHAPSTESGEANAQHDEDDRDKHVAEHATEPAHDVVVPSCVDLSGGEAGTEQRGKYVVVEPAGDPMGAMRATSQAAVTVTPTVAVSGSPLPHRSTDGFDIVSSVSDGIFDTEGILSR